MIEITEDDIYVVVNQAWKNKDDETAAVIAKLYEQRNQATARITRLEAELRKVVQSKEVAMPIELDEEIKELLKMNSAGGASK